MRRSSAPSLLATSLVIAEFDIDTGACLRACYPRPLTDSLPASLGEPTAPTRIAGHSAEYFANVMLPDGAEKVKVTRTVFVVNRPKPPAYERFPVYRFARTVPTVSSSVGSPLHGLPMAWQRRPGEDTALYVAETFLINTNTAEVSLRYKDVEIEAPHLISMEHISSLPSVPSEVVRFTKQLEAMLMNEATISGSRGTSFAAFGEDNTTDGAGSRGGTTGSSGTISGSAGGASSEFAFVVMSHPMGGGMTRQDGFLMRVAHFERLLRSLTVLLTRESTETTASAGVSDGGYRGSPRESETGCSPECGAAAGTDPLSRKAAGSTRQVDRAPGIIPVLSYRPTPVSVAAAQSGGAPSYWDPPTLGIGREDVSGGVSSRSSERYSGGGTLGTSPTHSVERWDHLILPGTDSASNEGAADRDTTVAAVVHHVDPYVSSSTPSAASPKRPSETQTGSGTPPLFGLCAVVSKRDNTARRGGITKSVAALGPSLVWLEPFFPALVAAAQYCCDVNGTDENAVRELQRILKRCYDSINNAAEAVAARAATVDPLTAAIGKYCTLSSGQEAYVFYSDAPFGSTIKAKIPISPESNDIAFNRYNLETIIEVFGPSFLQLLLGILTEKKILILSRQGEAADVCEVALSLGILGNLLDGKFMTQKVFPYVSVSSVDCFKHVPGYIVGTLNPIFDNVHPWCWDLLCDLDGKTVITAAERLQRRSVGTSSAAGGNWSAATAGLASAVGVGGNNDTEALRIFPAPFQQLYKQLVSTLYHLRALRIGASERNRRLRLMLEDFIYTFVLVGYATGGNISVPSALYPTFAHRSLAAVRSEMMQTAMMDSVRTHVLHLDESPAMLLCCAALRHCAWGETPVQRTLRSLLALLNTPHDIRVFLRRMTLAVGGLNAVGMQLTHPSAETRAAAAALLARLDAVPEGKAAIASMNNFCLMVYESSSAAGAR